MFSHIKQVVEILSKTKIENTKNKAIVCGDRIVDQYKTFTATRICPEAPVPVLVPTKPIYESAGGAGLVSEQLKAFRVETFLYGGSISRKERIFADDQLICRCDYDSLQVFPDVVEKSVIGHLWSNKDIGLIIISDYGKGAFTPESAKKIMKAAKKAGVPVFVDAKRNWKWYPSAFAFFPNKFEHEELWEAYSISPKHTVRKVGAEGCIVDGEKIAGNKVEVKDSTGAGDVFLAAFAAKFLKQWPPVHKDSIGMILQTCARFANTVAAESVRHLGTHVVKGPLFTP